MSLVLSWTPLHVTQQPEHVRKPFICESMLLLHLVDVCHWMCPSVGATAQEDLQCIVNHFYSTSPPGAASTGMYNAC